MYHTEISYSAMYTVKVNTGHPFYVPPVEISVLFLHANCVAGKLTLTHNLTMNPTTNYH